MTFEDRLRSHMKNIYNILNKKLKADGYNTSGFWGGKSEHAKTRRHHKKTKIGSDLGLNELK